MTKTNTLKFLLAFSFVMGLGGFCFSQKPNDASKEDTVTKTSGHNITMLPEFKYQIESALLHYPELKDTRIVFKYKHIKTTMECRPKFFPLSIGRKNRTYYIYVNNDTAELKNALLQYVPLNGQIGVIGHEFGHLVDYQNKGFFGVLRTGYGYLFVRYKSRLEKKVDRITIAHGLKKELIEFCDYILNTSNAPLKYKVYKKKIYYSPQQLGLL